MPFSLYGVLWEKMNLNFSSYLVFQVDYYAHPDQYRPIFHEKIAPYASVIGMLSFPYFLVNFN